MHNNIIVSEDGKGLNYGKEKAKQVINEHNDSIREAHERWKKYIAEQAEKKRTETEQVEQERVEQTASTEPPKVEVKKRAKVRAEVRTEVKRKKTHKRAPSPIPSPMVKAMAEYEGRQRGIKEFETELATRLLKKGMERRLEGQSDIDFWVLDEIYNLSWELRHGCEINRNHIW